TFLNPHLGPRLVTVSLPTTYNLIATDRPGQGDPTILLGTDIYEYIGGTRSANFSRVTFDPSRNVLSGDANGTPVNAVLVGGNGNDYFDYQGGGSAILIGGAGNGNNELIGGQVEFGGNIPLGMNFPELFPIPASVQVEIGLQTQIRFVNPPAAGNDTLIGTPGND